MVVSEAVVSGPTSRLQSRYSGLRKAAVTMLVALCVQFALGISVNLFTELPPPGQPGHGAVFGNGVLLILHAALGALLVIDGIVSVVRAARIGRPRLIVLAAIGMTALLFAAAFGLGFVDQGADGLSLGMALSFAAAVASYAGLLYLAGPRNAEAAGDR